MASKLPVVAIVGRANAGKSALFNRLVGTRRAIVSREAGTTRDSVVARIDNRFLLIDTAGLKNPEDEFEATIQDQIADAVTSAEAVLFVVDSTEYPDQTDRELAKKVLKSGKPVVLCVNKIDLKGSLPAEEFLKLGIKDIVKTSAEHGRGVPELRKRLLKMLPEAYEKTVESTKVALIGRPNVGKSSLFNTLAGKQQAIVANLAGTTRDVNRVGLKFKSENLELLDTAGVRRPGKVERGVENFSVLRTMAAVEESDVCLLLLDATELATALDQKLAGIIEDAGKGLIIVVTKWDQLADKDGKTGDEVAARVAELFDFVPFAPLIFTSAVTGQNATKIFDLILGIKQRRLQQIPTRELNKVLAKAVSSHPPAGLKNTHPKFRYVVQTDTAPPWFVIYGSHFKFIHWSYKRYLERMWRENFDLAGTPIKFSFRDEKQIKKGRENGTR
ncbi:ribosome biogenesis GTPase Der [Candidatus Saccharibacteria bacterium]|nr:ribosome biogenesis GTPase Der [Candidatus Saccharibacteria bacterium]